MSGLLVSPAGTATEDHLRARLRQNATFSAVGGVVAAAGCVPLSHAMGIDRWWLLLGVGIGLLGFAALVWSAAARPTEKLATEALQISVADAGWVVGSVVLVALGVFSDAGDAVVLAQAAVVAFFGSTQALLRRRLWADAAQGVAQDSNAPMS